MFEEYDYYQSIKPSAIPNRGIAFQNAFKSRAEHPDYIGKLTLEDGSILRIGVYLNQNKVGKDYFTFSLEKE